MQNIPIDSVLLKKYLQDERKIRFIACPLGTAPYTMLLFLHNRYITHTATKYNNTVNSTKGCFGRETKFSGESLKILLGIGRLGKFSGDLK